MYSQEIWEEFHEKNNELSKTGGSGGLFLGCQVGDVWGFHGVEMFSNDVAILGFPILDGKYLSLTVWEGAWLSSPISACLLLIG